MKALIADDRPGQRHGVGRAADRDAGRRLRRQARRSRPSSVTVTEFVPASMSANDSPLIVSVASSFIASVTGVVIAGASAVGVTVIVSVPVRCAPGASTTV